MVAFWENFAKWSIHGSCKQNSLLAIANGKIPMNTVSKQIYRLRRIIVNYLPHLVYMAASDNLFPSE